MNLVDEIMVLEGDLSAEIVVQEGGVKKEVHSRPGYSQGVDSYVEGYEWEEEVITERIVKPDVERRNVAIMGLQRIYLKLEPSLEGLEKNYVQLLETYLQLQQVHDSHKFYQRSKKRGSRDKLKDIKIKIRAKGGEIASTKYYLERYPVEV